MTPEPAPAEVVPFGKYRNRPVTDLLADRDYVDWLLAQPWFSQKHQTIYNVVIGAGGPEPQDNPEHNAMQARFLDDDLCLRGALRFLPDRDELLDRARTWRAENATEAQIANLDLSTETYSAKVSSLIEFEVEGWDVVYRAKATLAAPAVRVQVSERPEDCPICRPTEHSEHCKETTERLREEGKPPEKLAADGDLESCWHCWPRFRHFRHCPASESELPDTTLNFRDAAARRWKLCRSPQFETVAMQIELKPVIGDDYPSVLRDVIKRRDQQAARGHWREEHRAVVIADRIQPSSVTVDQVRKIFASRQVHLLLFDEFAGAGQLTLGGQP